MKTCHAFGCFLSYVYSVQCRTFTSNMAKVTNNEVNICRTNPPEQKLRFQTAPNATFSMFAFTFNDLMQPAGVGTSCVSLYGRPLQAEHSVHTQHYHPLRLSSFNCSAQDYVHVRDVLRKGNLHIFCFFLSDVPLLLNSVSF